VTEIQNNNNKGTQMSKTKIAQFCAKHNMTANQFYGKEKIEGDLYLRSVTQLPDGFAPTVGGCLDLSSVTQLPDGFAPTVGGGLDLRSVTQLPDGFAPTVGGGLYLRSVTQLPDGFAPTVGGGLDLRDGLKADKIAPSYPLSWQDGKYLLLDGELTEIASRRGNVYKGKIIGKTVACYVVTNGEGGWAHGATLKEAKKDLLYKNSVKDVEQYRALKVTDKMSFSEAVACYRAITGACSFGVRNFVESTGLKEDGKYSVKDILKVAEGKYGWEKFKEFFSTTKA